MEGSTNISKKQDEKKPIEKIQETLKKIDSDMVEIKEMVKELKEIIRKKENEKGWFY